MKQENSITSLVVDKEDLFLSGQITSEEFWEYMDTYSYGKGLKYLAKGWETKAWKDKRALIIQEQKDDSGLCKCSKCGVSIEKWVTIQHHKHPRKFKDILKEEKVFFADKLMEQSFAENGHNFSDTKNKCIECGSYARFLPYTKKWECSKTKKIYDKCKKTKVPWSLWKYKKEFSSKFFEKKEAHELSLPVATKKYIAESRAYRNLDNKVFPYSIYCRDCAFEEDSKSRKIKKKKTKEPKKEEIPMNIEDYKPKVRIRRKK